MKSFLIKNKRILLDIAILIGVFLFVFLAFFIFKPLYFRESVKVGSTDGVIPRIFIYLCLLIIIVVGIVLKIKNNTTILSVPFRRNYAT